MKKMNYRLSILLILLLSLSSGYGQTVIYRENFGHPTGNIPIQQYTGWQNGHVVYSGDGTCDVRTSTPSTDYGQASGGGNVMINNTVKWFQISNLNTLSYEDITLNFGLKKGSTAENGGNFLIQVSQDGSNWQSLPPYTGLPTGTGSTGWYYVTIEDIPSYATLHIRFSNLSSVDFRLDDISLSTSTAINTPYIEWVTPQHGGIYEERIEPEISIMNFMIGEDGVLQVELTGENENSIHYFSDEDSLLHFLDNFPVLEDGNYTFTARLLNPDSSAITPAVTSAVSFTVVSPTAATPLFSPNGGSYYTTQQVSITSATPDCTIYYTLDGSLPDENSSAYVNPIEVSSTMTIKAVARKTGMEPSSVAMADYIIRDTTAALSLPFDISSNGTTNQEDITSMNGFSGYHLGSSYADGSVKFEQARAGTARLSAKLNDAPDTLWFDVKGRVGGSTPQSYEDIQFQISESQDNHNWTVLATLTEAEIGTSAYRTFRYILKPETRFIQWKLVTAEKGNTQLNNIKIGKYTQPSLPSHTEEKDIHNLLTVYPNPATLSLRVETHECNMDQVSIIDMAGRILRTLEAEDHKITVPLHHLPNGVYFIRVITDKGNLVKKIIKH